MTLRETIAHIKADPADAWYYWQGTIRYHVYRRWPFLLRAHIREQYEYRKKAAEPCYITGSCRCCGCRTPELFFADKGCSISKKGSPPHCKFLGPACYPEMMNRQDWIAFKSMQK